MEGIAVAHRQETIAIEQAAQEHGISIDTVQAVFSHAGSTDGLGGAFGSLANGLFNKS